MFCIWRAAWRGGIVRGTGDGVCGLLALLFIVVPALEIYLIIEVGGLIGTWPMLGVMGVTAVLGASLAKSQGTAVLAQLKASMATGEGTGTAIIEGSLVLVAGVTLLAPGLLTDAVGLALLVPPIRRAIAGRYASKVSVVSPMAGAARCVGFAPGTDNDDPPGPGVIDV